MCNYGDIDNLTKALMIDTEESFETREFAREIARRDLLLIDEALHLIEKYKKLGVNDYDDLMIWITERNK